MKDELKNYPVDVDENTLFRKSRELLKILLTDRTTNRNITWATNTYENMGNGFSAKDTITIKHVTGELNKLIRPRIEKMKYEQKNRTKRRAEVFTPTWIVKMQNDIIEQEFSTLSLKEYIAKTWLEITCGEAPYIVSRYDAVSGNPIPLSERVGFLDRKLQRINAEVENPSEWIIFVKKAYESSFGYEFQGDSLLIARENLLYTFIDYYQEKFKYEPDLQLQLDIAKIISYNVFQADGLKDIVPLSEKVSDVEQISLFEDFFEPEIFEQEMSGIPVKIKNWRSKRMVEFRGLKKGDESMKFDVVIGNPPYQEVAKGGSSKDMPIYHRFLDESYNVSLKTILITPARFLSNAGGTPKRWNEKMLMDNHLKIIYFEQDSSKIFSNTDIKGGIAISYRDENKIFEPIKIFTPFEELRSILNKVESHDNFHSFSDIVSNRGVYRYSDLIYDKYPKQMKRVSDRRLASNAFEKLPEFFFDSKPNDGYEYVQIYGRIHNTRQYKWFRKDFMNEPDNFNKYKVILPKANGSGAIGEVLSTPLIGAPLIGYTESFIGIGQFCTELEAKAALKYVKSKFARAMLGILKITQDNTKLTWSKVPLQDFTGASSDIDWSNSIAEIDLQLYEKYDLSENEIDFIESKVKEME